MSQFRIGTLTIDAVAYGSQGNAILGIRDTGKTYTATFIAERLFEAGIPFVAFDPVGVWKFLRVPGKGRGYPVVVAGGKDGDLPLTVAGAPEIVRAAMRNGVSLIIDLFDIHLSKADWRRIVCACVRVLLHENQSHGLRHVFIEEAAEFVPQRPFDMEVYAEIEKLARMGGNCRLGYTLINQRAQEVSKAVLELCENLFLHRQRGKNALESLTKWLDVADVATGRTIIKSLPDLPTGFAWAWMGGGETISAPTRIHVPRKNSAHPDRRLMRGGVEAQAAKAVDVGRFVESMRAALVTVEAEVKANDPKALRAEIARLKAEVGKHGIDPATVEARLVEARAEGAFAAIKNFRPRLVTHIGEIIASAAKLAEHAASLKRITDEMRDLPAAHTAEIGAFKRYAETSPKIIRRIIDKTNGADLPRPQRRVIESLGFWASMGEDAPRREQVASVAGYSPGSGGFNNLLGTMHTADLIGYPYPGGVAITDSGRGFFGGDMTVEDARKMLTRVLSDPESRVAHAAICQGEIAREKLAELSGYSAGSGGFNNICGTLCGMGVFDKPKPGHVALSGWARQVLEE